MNLSNLRIAAIPALFALAAAGIVACSPDDTTITPPPPSSAAASSSSFIPYSAIPVTEISPIDFQEITVTSNGDMTKFIFSGSATLDAWDSATVEANQDNASDPVFTGVDFQLLYISNGVESMAPLSLTYDPGVFPRSAINFSDMGLRLEDPGKNLCGDFRIVATVYATNDLNDPQKFASNKSLDFSRPFEACQEEIPPSSSSAFVSTVELTHEEAQMSTSPALGLSLTTGTSVAAADAHIKLSLGDGNSLVLTTLNGYKITEFSNGEDKNWDDDWDSTTLPPEPAHLSDFRFYKSKLSDTFDGFDVSSFYVVIGPNYNEDTGDDFFAITLKDKSNITEAGLMTATVIIYKKK